MSSDKAKQAAEEWGNLPENFHANDFGDDSGKVWSVVQKAYIAGVNQGRAHFIEHELRGLLELHHEDIYEHTIDELIEKARKG